jgi:hypothetical protein
VVLIRRGWLIAAVTLISNCSCPGVCTPERCPLDYVDAAGADGAEAGAAPDAFASSDAATPCTDAPTDPCWAPIAGLPGRCDVWRARHPERIAIATPTDCGAGCTVISLDSRWVAGRETGWLDPDGTHYVHLLSADAAGPDYWLDAIVESSARVTFAIRYPPGGGSVHEEICRPMHFAVGEGFGAFDVLRAVAPDNVPAQEFVYYAPLAELATVPDPVETVDVSHTFGVLELAVSSRGVVWEREAGGQGLIDGTYVDFGAGLHHPRVLDADVLWINQRGQLHLWSAGLDTTLFDLAPLIADGGVLADGTNIGWIEFTDGAGTTTGVLRAGPFTRPAFTPPPVLETDLPVLNAVMGDGLIAREDWVVGSPPTFLGYRVIDVATGSTRRFSIPAGQYPEFLHLVSRDELVVQTHDDATGRWLYVVDPSTLPIVP